MRCCELDTDGDGNCPIHIRPGILRLNLDKDSPYKQRPDGTVLPKGELIVCRSCGDPTLVFVFGSNLGGRHGAGAAYHAVKCHGAIYGNGEGLQGSSYALPTLGHHLETLPFRDVESACERFVVFAEEHQELRFDLTKVGTGLAGIPEPMMKYALMDAPRNVLWPVGWVRP